MSWFQLEFLGRQWSFILPCSPLSLAIHLLNCLKMHSMHDSDVCVVCATVFQRSLLWCIIILKVWRLGWWMFWLQLELPVCVLWNVRLSSKQNFSFLSSLSMMMIINKVLVLCLRYRKIDANCHLANVALPESKFQLFSSFPIELWGGKNYRKFSANQRGPW